MQLVLLVVTVTQMAAQLAVWGTTAQVVWLLLVYHAPLELMEALKLEKSTLISA